MVAGLTLAAYAVPVSVAYASLAGLPPQAGLYCYLLGGVAYAAFGTSRQLAIGPTSAISILIGSAVGTLAAGDTLRQVHLAATVAVLAGFIGIIAWTLRLGTIANFVSETVLSGFKTRSRSGNCFDATAEVIRHQQRGQQFLHPDDRSVPSPRGYQSGKPGRGARCSRTYCSWASDCCPGAQSRCLWLHSRSS